MSWPTAKISNLDQKAVEFAANNICMRFRVIINLIFWSKTIFIDLIQNQNRLFDEKYADFQLFCLKSTFYVLT